MCNEIACPGFDTAACPQIGHGQVFYSCDIKKVLILMQ